MIPAQDAAAPAHCFRPSPVRHFIRNPKDIFPIYVEVSPVGFCNHDCTFCGVDYMVDRTEKPQLSAEVMKKLLTDMGRHGVLSVMFAGAGEPLLYKPLADCILHAHSVGIDTSITTNGVLFTDAFARRVFLAERLRWIKVSINAGTPDTYAAIHRTRPQDFDRVLKRPSKCGLRSAAVAPSGRR